MFAKAKKWVKKLEDAAPLPSDPRKWDGRTKKLLLVEVLASFVASSYFFLLFLGTKAVFAFLTSPISLVFLILFVGGLLLEFQAGEELEALRTFLKRKGLL